jgi:hypothetical protein
VVEEITACGILDVTISVTVMLETTSYGMLVVSSSIIVVGTAYWDYISMKFQPIFGAPRNICDPDLTGSALKFEGGIEHTGMLVVSSSTTVVGEGTLVV